LNPDDYGYFKQNLCLREAEGVVKNIWQIAKSEARMNAGFYVFRRGIFNNLREGEVLVENPLNAASSPPHAPGKMSIYQKVCVLLKLEARIAPLRSE
jgi:hypothetical protein